MHAREATPLAIDAFVVISELEYTMYFSVGLSLYLTLCTRWLQAFSSLGLSAPECSP